MTGYLSDEVRAVILSALMVLSVFGGTVAFSGTAAAIVTDISGASAQDVQAGETTIEQTVTFDVTLEGGPDTVDLEISTSSSTPTVDGNSEVSLTGDTSDVSLSSVDDDNRGEVEIGLDDTTDNGAHTVTVDVTVTHDTTGFASTTSETYTIEYSFGIPGGGIGTLDATASFEVTTDSRSALGSGAGDVYDGATVFQGEEGITFVNQNGIEVDSVTGASGDAEGQVVSLPIPSDQTVGRYSADGTETFDSGNYDITIDTPRVTDFEVQNQNGADISGGSVSQSDADLKVGADYNFENAEALEINVDDADGLSITDDVVVGSQAKNPLNSPPNPLPSFDVGYTVDLQDQDAGTYTITVEGDDDLDFGGEAVSTTTVDVTGTDNVGIELASDTVSQGDNVRYDVTGAIAGDFHVVQINDSEFNDNADTFDAGTIFRDVEDVEERGIIVDGNFHEVAGTADSPVIEADPGDNNELPNGVDDVDAAYAVVEIDDGDGLGIGSIDSTALEDTSVTIEVSDAIDNEGDIGDGADNTDVETFTFLGEESTDDTDLEVEEGTLTLDSPGQTYVVGSEVDVNGTASTGIDDVAIYVRDEDQFELVGIGGSSTVSVDADGSFEETDIVFSANSEILRLPGSYRVGIIDADDANLDSTEGNNIDGISTGSAIDQKITTSDFNSETSDQRSIRVIGQSLSAEFTSPVNGQIALEQDGANVEVSGSAPGSEDVLLIAVGPRGNIVAQQVGVETDQTFEEDSFDITDLNKGAASLHVYSIGRDDRVGDNDLPDSFAADSLGEFQRFLTEVNANTRQSLQEQDLTGDQVRSSILAQTVEDDATDDALVNANVRLVDSQSRIVNVYQEGNEASGLNPVAAGETMIVEVQTNLKSDDNTISLEVQNEDVTVGLSAVDEWGDDGRATLTLDTEDAATGTYSVEIDDGHNSVTEEIELVEEVSTATPTPTEADDTPTATDSPTPTATASPTATEMPDTDTSTPTEGGGPGFGAVVALVALLAAALLATRRDN